jgi:hypothetical protein
MWKTREKEKPSAPGGETVFLQEFIQLLLTE